MWFTLIFVITKTMCIFKRFCYCQHDILVTELLTKILQGDIIYSHPAPRKLTHESLPTGGLFSPLPGEFSLYLKNRCSYMSYQRQTFSTSRTINCTPGRSKWFDLVVIILRYNIFCDVTAHDFTAKSVKA